MEEKAEAVIRETTATKSLGGTETILLVEDEESVRTVTREFLEMGGYTVLEATNGAEAIEIAKRHRGQVHLLLTDVVMPGMSGRQLAEELAGEHRVMKVLYMSGYTDDTVARREVLETDFFLLEKPFTRDSVTGKVREVLEAGEEKKR